MGIPGSSSDARLTIESVGFAHCRCSKISTFCADCAETGDSFIYRATYLPRRDALSSAISLWSGYTGPLCRSCIGAGSHRTGSHVGIVTRATAVPERAHASSALTGSRELERVRGVTLAAARNGSKRALLSSWSRSLRKPATPITIDS